MHYKLMFPSRYLDAATLQGRDVVVEIESVSMQTLEGEKGERDKRPCVRLAGKTKIWVLNKTNARVIAKLYGPDVDDWRGQCVTVYPTKCEAFGETVECVRVRPSKPQRPANGNGHDAVPDQDMDDAERAAIMAEEAMQ